MGKLSFYPLKFDLETDCSIFVPIKNSLLFILIVEDATYTCK
jgi:hypothetical protein